MWRPLWICWLICGMLPHRAESGCNRIPPGANGERSPVDENFKILIDGNPTTYIPDHPYNVSLSCPINLKFVGFTLVVESEQPAVYNSGVDTTGHFELFSVSDTRFSPGCENMIESTNTNAKTRIDVSWVAPKQPDSGCVLIKAGVVQHRDVWFIDDGFLTKRICAEEIDELNSLTPPVEHCCACDEAKYEIIVERKWARNTHAKDFPSEAWRTRLSEVIGASHSHGYRYWAYGGRASPGLRELAEHGATRTLEQEIRENTQNGEVRTIIKAPSIGHRLNVLGTTLANARLDPQHHQISLTTKIDPSPDWILGVAGLELCLRNCTWVERKVLNLYPWDIGTDAGPSYMSADEQQVPPDVIRRITSSYPSDYRSPFFDDTGAPLKPLATLYVNRQKLYVRECEAIPQEGPLECALHPWNDWSSCSTRCGPGYMQRMRSYKNPVLAASYSCEHTLEETRSCRGMQCGSLDESTEDETAAAGMSAECELTVWSSWSPCSKPCGRGSSTRTRDFRNRAARMRCMAGISLPLEETRECTGTDCGGVIPGSFDAPAEPANSAEREQFGETNEAAGKPAWQANSYAGNSNTNYKVGMPDYAGSNDFYTTQPTPSYERYRPNSYRNEPIQPEPTNMPRRKPFNYNDYAMPGLSTRSPVNRFASQDADERRGLTVGGLDPSNYNVVQDYCFEKPFASTRACRASPLVVRNYWFYDHEDHECKIFTTDNCDDNRNKFRSLTTCEATCRLPQMNREQAENEENMEANAWTGDDMQEGVQGFGAPMSQTKGRQRYSTGRGRYSN